MSCCRSLLAQGRDARLALCVCRCIGTFCLRSGRNASTPERYEDCTKGRHSRIWSDHPERSTIVRTFPGTRRPWPILASIAAALVLLGACFLIYKANPQCLIERPRERLDWGSELDDSSAPGRPSESGTRRSKVIGARDELEEAVAGARRRWETATWFGVATFIAWSPVTAVNRLLPAGSTTRGVVLTLIPLMGVLAVLRLPNAAYRKPFDLLVGLLGVLVIWEAISVERTAGTVVASRDPSCRALSTSSGSPRSGYGNVCNRHSICSHWCTARIVQSSYSWMDCSIRAFGARANHDRSLTSFEFHGPRLSASRVSVRFGSFRIFGGTDNTYCLRCPARKNVVVHSSGGPSNTAGERPRTSIIVLGVGLFVLWVSGPGLSAGNRMKALLLLAIVGIGAWRIIDVQRQVNTDVLSGRDLIWRDLIPYLHHLPILGFGPNFFPRLVPLVFGQFALPGQVLDPQNQWLNDSLEFG